MTKLLLQALLNLVIGSVIFGALLFLSAGTIAYWQAWVFIVVFAASSNGIGIYLSLKDPALLERRKNLTPAAPASSAQQIMGVLIVVGVLALLVVPALDHRFAWSSMPAIVPIVGNLLVLLSFVAFYFVFKENSYGASTIEIFEGQRVISTGPYGIVRHPMYSAVVVMCVGAVLALGSWWGLLIIALMQLPVLAWRILDEESVLMRDLPGYPEYMKSVQYRLVPHVW